MLSNTLRSFLVAASVATVIPAAAQAGLRDCEAGKISVGGECVAKEQVRSRIDEIVRKAMAEEDLKAVIAGGSVDGKPILNEAWGETMTGVPATPDMHFRNASVSIAYLGVVTFQLQEKGLLSLDDVGRRQSFPSC